MMTNNMARLTQIQQTPCSAQGNGQHHVPSRHTYILAFVGAGTITVAIIADRLGILNGVPHPVSALRVLGFACIAAGLWFILFRR